MALFLEIALSPFGMLVEIGGGLCYTNFRGECGDCVLWWSPAKLQTSLMWGLSGVECGVSLGGLP